MLSSIGRASVRRVVTRGSQSTNRAVQGVWQLQRADNLESANDRSQLQFTLRRSYATATKVVAKPKATKKTATKPAAKQPAKTVKKEKVAAKKKPVKKPVKKVVKKPVVKKPLKVKPPPTEKQLAKQAVKDRGARVKALKAVTLEIPKLKIQAPHTLHNSEQILSRAPGAPITAALAEANAKWKTMSPAEREPYIQQANLNKLENEAAYQKWVESYSVLEIRQANDARRALRSLASKGARISSAYTQSIKDERQPKRPCVAHLLFTKDRWASGDFKGVAVDEAAKIIVSKEWPALTDAERQVYKDRQAEDKARYVREFTDAFGSNDRLRDRLRKLEV